MPRESITALLFQPEIERVFMEYLLYQSEADKVGKEVGD